MPKIIFTSHYMRDAPPEHLKNYVEYVGTREGVEKLDESKALLPATMKQQQLIEKIVRDIPESRRMLEYADYRLHPTIGNASEFITQALEQNLDLIGKRQNYVDYLANRPRVERVGEHGLFTDAGVPVVLSQVQEDVVAHKGPVWTHVVSLRREDAARLGYDRGKEWMALMRSKRAMFTKHMKIGSENLRWYAAYHNESHHPHVHIMVYSAKDNDGFLTKESIEAMRSELAHDIFRQDFAHIYEQQNQARADLKQSASDLMQELLLQIASGVCENKEVEEKILRLAGRLQNTGGKKVYGYLKADVKALVDQIVDALAGDTRVARLYAAWGDWQDEILKTYTGKLSQLPPLSRQPQFKSIKNMVIVEAMKIGGHQFTFEDDSEPDANGTDMVPEPDESLPEPDAPPIEWEEPLPNAGEAPDTPKESVLRAEWSKDYKLARKYLYGGNDVVQDFAKAYLLFLSEAESGNALAMHDLGRMCADGLGMEIDMAASQEWYAKALAAFLATEATAKERQRPYLQYRIGKMYAAGQGIEQDYGHAAKWLSQAVSADHKYAEYSLAGLYYRGQGVAQSYETAFDLYRRSVEQTNPYASYELGKMCRDGIGTEKDSRKAGAHFEDAFTGFYQLEKDSHDDKLQYRLGQMLHTGTGTDRDDNAAMTYFEKSAKLGNINAQYALGKLRLATGVGDLAQAVAWIAKATDSGNAAAQYALAKLFRDGKHVEKNMTKAVELFTASAEQKNEYAAYALGRLYLAGEDIPKDIEAAVRWLSFSADLNNPYAQYTLGKLYLTGEQLSKDIGIAVKLLLQSAEQKNQFAEYQLGKLYLTGEDVPKDVEAAIRWFSASAEQGNQFAQYALGKLYLCGHDVSRDREKAIPLLEASAAQGNIYAQFLLEHLDSFREPSVLLAATRLLHRIGNAFREDYNRATGGGPFQIDRKRRRQLREKQIAQGHARDDHEQQHQIHY